MEVTKLGSENHFVELRVHAYAGEVHRAFHEGLEAFIETYNLEGLDGDTPEEKIVNAVGEDQAQDVISQAVIGHLIPFALDEAGVIPMATSRIEADSDPQHNEEFEFTVKVLAKPSYELSNYDPVEVSVPARGEVTEADIDQQVAMLAEQYAIVKVNPETGEQEIIPPEITDEWVVANLSKEANLYTVAELRQQFREASEKVREQDFEQSKTAAVLAEYAKRFEGEITPEMVEAMTTDMFETFKADVQHGGTTMMEYMHEQRTDEKQIRAALAMQAEAQIKQGLVLDAIYRHEKLRIEMKDLRNMIKSMAPDKDEQDTYDLMQKTGRLFLLREGTERMKAADWAVEHATINIIE